MSRGRKIAVIGLGYVGLSVAAGVARAGSPVIGFDIDGERVRVPQASQDPGGRPQARDLRQSRAEGCRFFHRYRADPDRCCRQAGFERDVRSLTHGRNGAQAGDILVYPGAIEDDCVPNLERASGLKAGAVFNASYSPVRINPDGRNHRFETITKATSAQNARALDIVADVYGSVVTAGIHRAPSTKVAEAAKMIENAQRDLNIAFMNELSTIFQTLGIDTGDVLAAAGTKWNFLPFQSSLVGGHCIGVDSYFLTYCAEKAGYHPEVILVGRSINDEMGRDIARECIHGLLRRKGRSGVVTILGTTFKENVPNIRNFGVTYFVRELKSIGVKVQITDPLADPHAAEQEYGVALHDIDALEPADAVILAVAHDAHVEGDWRLVQRLLHDGAGLVFDVKMKLDRGTKRPGIEPWRL